MRVLCVLAIAACGRLHFDAAASPSPDATISPRCAGPFLWSAPRVIPELSSALNEFGPAISPDNQTMVFESDRDGSVELYLATRQGASWSTPQAISSLDQVSCDQGDPAWSYSGANLYFYRDCSDRLLAVAAYDGNGVFESGDYIAGLANEGTGPAVSADERELYYTDVTADANKLERADRATPSDAWTDPGPDTSLDLQNSTVGWPSLAADGVTLYFETDYGATGGADIYRATRVSGGTFGDVVPESELNVGGVANDGDPDIAWDCESLYFASDRSGGVGESDLYVATRTN